MSKLRILLADDNSAVLDQVSRALAKEYEVIAALKEGHAVVKECLRQEPDVVILDISIGDVSGIDLARELRDAGCRSRVVFLTVHEDYDFVNAALSTGALAYVVKSRLSADLVSGIEAAMAAKLFLSSSLMYQQKQEKVF
ncbi:MAG TPA: response regulator transcription factor [Silvibacterium sp.]|nr:response regulator transcription factor [Silvibacterium sp.]